MDTDNLGLSADALIVDAPVNLGQDAEESQILWAAGVQRDALKHFRRSHKDAAANKEGVPLFLHLLGPWASGLLLCRPLLLLCYIFCSTSFV